MPTRPGDGRAEFARGACIVGKTLRERPKTDKPTRPAGPSHAPDLCGVTQLQNHHNRLFFCTVAPLGREFRPNDASEFSPRPNVRAHRCPDLNEILR